MCSSDLLFRLELPELGDRLGDAPYFVVVPAVDHHGDGRPHGRCPSGAGGLGRGDTTGGGRWCGGLQDDHEQDGSRHDGIPRGLVGRLDSSYGEKVGRVPAVTKTEQAPEGIPRGLVPSKALVVPREQAWLDRCLGVEHEVTGLEARAAQRQCQDFVQIFHEVHVE